MAGQGTPDASTKYCGLCERWRPRSEFWRCARYSDGLRPGCRQCHSEKKKQWRRDHLHEVRAYERRYQRASRPHVAKAWRDKIKQALLDAYGGKCACCGEETPEFLTLDHVGGEIPPHHRTAAGKRIVGTKLYRLVLDEGCPPAYRLLCWNCNYAIGRFGQCPHEATIRKVA